MTIKHFILSAILAVACAQAFAGPVDVNSADAQTLARELNGVGLAKARAIVAWRDSNGDFKSIAELAQVKGIGVRILELNRDNIVLRAREKESR